MYIDHVLDGTTISRDHVVRSLGKKSSIAFTFSAGVLVLVTCESSKNLQYVHDFAAKSISFDINYSNLWKASIGLMLTAQFRKQKPHNKTKKLNTYMSLFWVRVYIYIAYIW